MINDANDIEGDGNDEKGGSEESLTMYIFERSKVICKMRERLC